MSAEFQWKPDQLAALLADGDLVLTASAGTGKTKILVAKFVRELFTIIRDSPPEALEQPGGSPLGRMVAITFTELAAAQLKGEIRSKLSAVMFGDAGEIGIVFPEANDAASLPEYRRDYLARLIRELDGSYIGTIHSFCSRLLRENYIEAGLSPSFGILSEDDARSRSDDLKRDAATEALEEALEDDDLLKALAASTGYGALRSELIYLADRLRTDGFSRIEPESIMEIMRRNRAEGARRAMKPLDNLLKQMSAELRGLPVSDLTEKNRPKADLLGELLKTAEPLIESEDSLLSSAAGDALAALRKMHLLTGKAPANVNLLQKAFQDLYDNGIPGDYPPLKNVAGIAADESNILALLRAVRLYSEIYERRKDALDLLDFNDLLLRTRDLLRDNRGVRERYHRQFTHLFVDEFQDVDPLQHEIISLLHKPGAGRALVVVGDGKQSIYRFRGADVLGFQEIASKVAGEGGRRMPLETNFRSNLKLVGAFNALFGYLFESERRTNRYQMEPADMVAHYEHAPDQPVVEWVRLEEYDPANEGLAIVRAILRLTDGTASNRKGNPLGFGDVAVLLTTYSNLTKYEDALRRHSIPYAVEGGRGYFRQREVWDILAYLKLLWLPDDDYALAAVLRSPFCLLSDESLLRLAQAGMLKGKELFEGDPPRCLPPEEAERLESLKGLIRRHRGLLDRLSTAEIIEELLKETGYEAVLLARAGGDQSATNVRKLIEMARDYESTGVDSGLRFVLDASGRMFARDTDNEPQAKLGGAAEGYVRILTIHRSKGLQFPAVVIPQLKYSGNRPTGPVLYDRYAGLGLKSIDPETGEASASPGWSSVADSINEQLDAEHLRLLYVAATRAQERVVMIGSLDKPKKLYLKPWEQRIEATKDEPGLYERIGISELGAAQLGPIERKAQSPADLHPQIRSLQPVAAEIEKEEAVRVEEIIQRTIGRAPFKPHEFACSVNRILELLGYGAGDHEPPEEAERDSAGDIDAFSATSRPAETGTAVHRLLESIDLASPPVEAGIAERLRRLGSDGVADEAARFVSRWLASKDCAGIAALETQREVPFSVKLQEGGLTLHLSGTIDLLATEGDGGHWIVDYKYAEPGDREAYRKQLQLYALALGRIPGLRPRRLSLVYLKGPALVDVPFDESSLEALKKEMFARIAQEWCAESASSDSAL